MYAQPVFTAAAFLVLAFGMYASVTSGWNFATAATSACVLLFFGHIDKFKQFKAGPTGGIDVILAEKVKEAEATIEQLRILARVLGEASLSQAIVGGRFVGRDRSLKVLDLQRKIFEVYDQLGLDENEKADAIRDVQLYTRFDYILKLTGGSTISYIPSDLLDEWKEMRHLEVDSSPESVRSLLARSGQLDAKANPEVELLLADFDHYCKTGEHQRIEVFLDVDWPEKYLQKRN